MILTDTLALSLLAISAAFSIICLKKLRKLKFGSCIHKILSVNYYTCTYTIRSYIWSGISMVYNVSMNFKCKMVLCSDSQSSNSWQPGSNGITIKDC